MLTVSKPQTFYIKFKGSLPRKFELYDSNGKLYFERYLDGKTPRIKFNVPNVGNYDSQNSFDVVKVVDIEIPKYTYSLPTFSRNRIKDFTIIDNPKLYNTPARVFTYEGIIEKGAKFNQYTQPTRVFFLLHEVGHFFYGLTSEHYEQANKMKNGKEWLAEKSNEYEMYCDLFALTHFLQMGYNMSTAMYALNNVLRRNKRNMDRVLFLYNHLTKK
jgi:hypothetical protein